MHQFKHSTPRKGAPGDGAPRSGAQNQYRHPGSPNMPSPAGISYGVHHPPRTQFPVDPQPIVYPLMQYPPHRSPYPQPMSYPGFATSYIHEQPGFSSRHEQPRTQASSSSWSDAPPPYSSLMESSTRSSPVPPRQSRQTHTGAGHEHVKKGMAQEWKRESTEFRGRGSGRGEHKTGSRGSKADRGSKVRSKADRGRHTGRGSKTVEGSNAHGKQNNTRKTSDSPSCSRSPSFSRTSESLTSETHEVDEFIVRPCWEIENWQPEELDPYDVELWNQDMEQSHVVATEEHCVRAVLVSGQLKANSRCALRFYLETVTGVEVEFMVFSADGQRAVFVFCDIIDLGLWDASHSECVGQFSVELSFSGVEKPSAYIMWLQDEDQIISADMFGTGDVTEVKHLKEFNCVIGICHALLTDLKPLTLHDSEPVIWPLFVEAGLIRSHSYFMQAEFEGQGAQIELPLLWVAGLSPSADLEVLRKFFIIEKWSGGDRTAEVGPPLSSTERLLKYSTPAAYSSVMRKACEHPLADPDNALSADGTLHVALRIEVPTPYASSQFLVLRDIPKHVTKEFLVWFLSARVRKRVFSLYFTEDDEACAVLFHNSAIPDLRHLEHSLEQIYEVSGMSAWQVPPVFQVMISGFNSDWTHGRFHTELTRWSNDHKLSRLAVYSYTEQCAVVSSADPEAIAAFLMRDPGELTFGDKACETPVVPILQGRKLCNDRLDPFSVCLDFLSESLKSYFLLPDVKKKLCKSHNAKLMADSGSVKASCTLEPSSDPPNNDFIKHLLQWRKSLLQEIENHCKSLEEWSVTISQNDSTKIRSMGRSVLLICEPEGSDLSLKALGPSEKIGKLKQILEPPDSAGPDSAGSDSAGPDSAGLDSAGLDKQPALHITFREAGYFNFKDIGRMVKQKYPSVNVKLNFSGKMVTLNIEGDKRCFADARSYIVEQLKNLKTTRNTYKKELVEFITSTKTSKYLRDALHSRGMTAFFDGKDDLLSVCSENADHLKKAVDFIRETALLRQFPVNSPASKDFFGGAFWERVKEEFQRKCSEQKPQLPVMIRHQGGGQPEKVLVMFVREAEPLVKHYIDDMLQASEAGQIAAQEMSNLAIAKASGPEKTLNIYFPIFADFQYLKYFLKKLLPKDKYHPSIEFVPKTFRLIATGPQDVMDQLANSIKQIRKSLKRGHMLIKNPAVVSSIAGMQQKSKPMQVINEASAETETAYVITSTHVVQVAEMFMPPRRINLCRESIFCIDADALLVAVTPSLDLHMTEVGRLLYLADPDFRVRLEQRRAKGDIVIGSCIHIHNPQRDSLFAHYIVLVMDREQLSSLQSSLYDALIIIGSMGLNSVALNLLGSDGLKIDAVESASTIMQSLERHFDKNPKSSLQTVYVCETNPPKVEISKAELEKIEVTQRVSSPNKLLDAVSIQMVSSTEQNLAKFKSRIEVLREMQM